MWGEGKDAELGVSRCKLVNPGQTNNKALLYRTEGLPGIVINQTGKEHENIGYAAETHTTLCISWASLQ